MNRHISRSLYNFEMFKLTTELTTCNTQVLAADLLSAQLKEAFIQKNIQERTES